MRWVRGRGPGGPSFGRLLPGVAALVVVAGLLQGCATMGVYASGGSGSGEEDEELVPPGYGTLRQDDVTLSLRKDDLLIKVTPLKEGVIRLTAPDTYDRLAGLKSSHGPALERQSGLEDPTLFLVSFFSYEPNIGFEPEDVQLVNQALRLRPVAIRPVTPRWGVQRLAQQETQMAVYAYDRRVDLEQELAVEYQDVRRAGWDRILQRIQAERARVRARARSERKS